MIKARLMGFKQADLASRKTVVSEEVIKEMYGVVVYRWCVDRWCVDKVVCG